MENKSDADPSCIHAQKELLRAQQFFQAGNVAAALALTIEIKRLRVAIRGLDLLRAACFLSMDRPGDVREALKEELRLFPDHRQAQQLLAEIVAREQSEQEKSPEQYDPEFTELLRIVRPYTMLPERRLFAVYTLAKQVCQSELPGNLIECGVAGGGSTAILAVMARRYSTQARKIFAFDSYTGMPNPTEHDKADGQEAESTGWGSGTCAAPEESVREVCKILEVDDLVIPVKGYFQDTLPQFSGSVGTLAFVHADCDWYESTKTILHTMYNNVTAGGVFIVDDYGYWEGVKKALDEFQKDRSLALAINDLGGSAWFQKPA